MIRDIKDILEQCSKNDEIIILYSGGLDGTYIISRLKDLGFKNIIAIHVDITGDESVFKVEDRLKVLDVEYKILNCVQDFIEGYVFEALKMKALYNNVYPISASLSRPLISKSIVDYIENNFLKKPVILHTSNSSQNSLRRFNNSFFDLGYRGLFGTPFEKTHISRLEKLDYLKSKNICFDLKISSEDVNIWCREFEYGSFDNVENMNIPDDAFTWTSELNTTNEILQIKIESGVPIQLNEKTLLKKDMILELRKIVGKYGIGRYIGLEQINPTLRVLEVRESPAATILIDAIKMLEMATFDYDTCCYKTNQEQKWIKEASEGRWFGKKRKEISSEISELIKMINGTVTYNLSKNNFFPISIKSSSPNYINDRDKFEQQQR